MPIGVFQYIRRESRHVKKTRGEIHMRYFFRHDKCGRKEEEVSEDTFKMFVGANWDSFRKAAIQADAFGGMIIFKDKCPFCSKRGRKMLKSYYSRCRKNSLHNTVKR
jgi:hypothetical protein